MNLAEGFVHHSAKHFRIPEIDSRKHGKDASPEKHVVKMGNDEISVVDEDIDWSGGHEDPGKASDHKHGDKSECVEHRRVEPDGAAPDCAQPVEGLDGLGNGDDHGGHSEGGGEYQIHPGDEHVVAPHDETEETDGDHRIDHGAIPEERLS